MKYPYTVKQDGIYYSPGTEVPDLEEKKAEELPEKPVKGKA